MDRSNAKIIYETQVQDICAEAKEFAEIKMLIMFGNEAPDALRSSCYIIAVNPIQGTIVPGMILQIDDHEYQITAVGNEVQRNLGNLGHIAISLTSKQKAELPGTLYIENGKYPDIIKGSTLKIFEN